LTKRDFSNLLSEYYPLNFKEQKPYSTAKMSRVCKTLKPFAKIISQITLSYPLQKIVGKSCGLWYAVKGCPKDEVNGGS